LCQSYFVVEKYQEKAGSGDSAEGTSKATPANPLESLDCEFTGSVGRDNFKMFKSD